MSQAVLACLLTCINVHVHPTLINAVSDPTLKTHQSSLYHQLLSLSGLFVTMKLFSIIVAAITLATSVAAKVCQLEPIFGLHSILVATKSPCLGSLEAVGGLHSDRRTAAAPSSTRANATALAITPRPPTALRSALSVAVPLAPNNAVAANLSETTPETKREAWANIVLIGLLLHSQPLRQMPMHRALRRNHQLRSDLPDPWHHAMLDDDVATES